MAERELPKLETGVRFPSPAPIAASAYVAVAASPRASRRFTIRPATICAVEGSAAALRFVLRHVASIRTVDGPVHLAQINVARLRAPIDDPATAEFVEGLERINALADTSAGFVWRLQTEDGNATAVRAYDDELVIVNMSVWTSLEALADYVYRSGHVEFLRRRADWFRRMGEANVALWWIEPGHRPPVAEGVGRLAHLRAHGATPRAFTFRRPFAPGGKHLEPADDRNACPA
jgi:hypothetical protein